MSSIHFTFITIKNSSFKTYCRNHYQHCLITDDTVVSGFSVVVVAFPCSNPVVDTAVAAATVVVVVAEFVVVDPS